MKAIYSKMYLDGSFVDTERVLSEEQSATYDVLRVIAGKPLFLEAHVERVNRSLTKMGYAERTDIPKVLAALIKENGNSRISCNVKILAGGAYRLAMGFVTSSYPDDKAYNEGVSLTTSHIERSNPEDKIWNDTYKEKIQELVLKKQVFEVLLVNDQDLVTEGSKSNVFFIKSGMVLTPATDVLPGITRKYAEQAIKHAGYELRMVEIGLSDLNGVDAAFLTGTSLHLLPISSIDSNEYDADNIVLRDCMKAFERVVDQDLTSKQGE